MKVLITGATGFVGSSLTRRLVGDGHDVHIISRQESQPWRIADLIPHLANHYADLRDACAVENVVTAIRPEIIFHLATYGGFAFQQNTDEIITSNVTGTINLLRACAKTGFSHFINTGSSSEYGIKTGPMKESDLAEPVGDYGVSKVAASLFCRAEAIRQNLPVVNFRLFSPYGPWDDPNRFIPYAITSLLVKEPPLLANSAAVRDYVFIDDVVAAYVCATRHKLIPGETYNIGSGTQHAIAQVIEILRDLIPEAPEPQWGVRDIQRPEPTQWVADISKACAAFEWAPATSLHSGLSRTMDWVREHLATYQKRHSDQRIT